MKRISISKSEGATEIVEKIIKEADSDLVLVLPKGAALASSAINFNLLKREADSAGKKIAIESVDEEILALAKSANIRAIHPFFETEGKKASFSDIVFPADPPAKAERKSSRGRKKLRIEGEPKEEAPMLAESEIGVPTALRVGKKPATKMAPEAVLKEISSTVENGRPAVFEGVREKVSGILGRFKIGKPSKKALFALGFAVALIVILAVLNGPFARATITIGFEKTPWQYEGAFSAATSTSRVLADRNILPGQLFITNKNLTHVAQASGIDEVAEKARGTIFIYNAFSSKPQVLVATTRFETPDGKIFRIINQITVPGAQIKDNKIIPSSIEADIIADKGGEAYNVGAIPRLAIPGFKGSPRYDGFYGEIKQPTKGGFIGRKAVPTADDISKAKTKTEELLRGGISTEFLASYPKDFKILDGASRIEITRINVSDSVDDKGNFGVFGEAKMSALGFKEEDLRGLLESMAAKNASGNVFKELELKYSNVQPDFKRGNLNFSVSAEGVLWTKFSTEEFEKTISGKKVGDVQLLISSLPGFTGGKVAIWPIWLGRVPTDLNKVKIIVD